MHCEAYFGTQQFPVSWLIVNVQAVRCSREEKEQSEITQRDATVRRTAAALLSNGLTPLMREMLVRVQMHRSIYVNNHQVYPKKTKNKKDEIHTRIIHNVVDRAKFSLCAQRFSTKHFY